MALFSQAWEKAGDEGNAELVNRFQKVARCVMRAPSSRGNGLLPLPANTVASGEQVNYYPGLELCSRNLSPDLWSRHW